MKNKKIFYLIGVLLFPVFLFYAKTTLAQVTCASLSGTCVPAVSCTQAGTNPQLDCGWGGVCCGRRTTTESDCNAQGGVCTVLGNCTATLIAGMEGACAQYTYPVRVCCSTRPQTSTPGATTTPNTAPGATAPAGGDTTIDFPNPIAPTTIQEFLQALLNNLRGIIVIISIIFIVIGALMYMMSAGNEKMITTAKSCITGALIGLAIAMAAPSFLQEILTMLGVNQTVPGAISLQAIALNVLKFLLSIGGVIAIISLIIGGITYTTAYGDEERLDKAKKIIAYSLLGIVIAMGALVLVKQVMSFFGA